MKYNVKDGFPYYIELIKEEKYHALFPSHKNFDFLEKISEEKSNYCYQEDK